MRNIRIILVPKYMTKEELKEMGIIPTATVEAEYGGKVIEGEQVTLAHHTKEYEHNPAPCNTPDVPVLADGSTIVVSHIDLDTIGGIAALLGVKPEDPEFWKAAEHLDVNGVHHIHEVPQDAQEKYLAYHAWCFANRENRITEVTDVTEDVLKKIAVIGRVVMREPELIAEGKRWDEETQKAIEECLIFENEHVRVFDSPTGIFCSAAYYSPNQRRIIPSTVVYNGKFKSVTVAFADGGKEFQKLGLMTARELVQKLWGPEAGGHPGIAGSPRGKEMTSYDRDLLAVTVDNEFLRAQRKKLELPEDEYEEVEQEGAITLRTIAAGSEKGVSQGE